MRYTLRLLTLDQLEPRRHADLRPGAGAAEGPGQARPAGRFEIGLWVGQAATPNRMGRRRTTTTRLGPDRKTIAFRTTTASRRPSRSKTAPGAATKFKPRHRSSSLPDSGRRRSNLRVALHRTATCDFTPQPSRCRSWPWTSRSIGGCPCFLIATVDKFAAMPWDGQIGALLRRVDRHDEHGFYGPCEQAAGRAAAAGAAPAARPDHPGRAAPDLRPAGDHGRALRDRPRRAVQPRRRRQEGPAQDRRLDRHGPPRRDQIQALFDRATVDIFPPPGPRPPRLVLRRDAYPPTREPTPASTSGSPPRDGASRWCCCGPTWPCWRPPRRRTSDEGPDNAADPYMTLLGYFNSLRELGGIRRIVEDEVRHAAHPARHPAPRRRERRASSPTGPSPTSASS